MQLLWCDHASPPPGEVRDGLVTLVRAVAATGGAVGWLSVPPVAEVQAWLDGLLGSGSRLVVALDPESGVLGCGAWRAHDHPVTGGMAVVSKVMTHPDARGRGAGRLVVQALVGDARAAGVELLTLDCRGNNHGALRLYAELGFVVTGRRPDALRVGQERFDQVLMHLDLRRGPEGLLRHGGRCEGPGAT